MLWQNTLLQHMLIQYTLFLEQNIMHHGSMLMDNEIGVGEGDALQYVSGDNCIVYELRWIMI
jgi:hypothetical protein